MPPGLVPHEGVLEGISARSSNDIFAVGWINDHNNNNLPRPLTLRWDGKRWTDVWCPTMGSEAQLFAVTYLPDGDAFAVGKYGDPWLGLNLTFAVRWDHNFNVWQISPTLDIPNADNFLYGVSGTSNTDVWAVGEFDDGFNPVQTLAQHFDGAAWRIVQTPNVGQFNSLSSVAAASPKDVWAAGMGNGNQTLIEHWDGQLFSVVHSPNDPGTAMGGWNYFGGIAAGAGGNLWAVGHYIPKQIAREILISHGDSLNWTIYPHPAVPPAQPKDQHSLRGVSIDSAGGAWAVGTNAIDRGGFIQSRALIVSNVPTLQVWTVMQDNPNDDENGLNGVAALDENDVWAVGWYGDRFNPVHCLIEHWDGNKWKAFP
jgi:hypothetical protein